MLNSTRRIYSLYRELKRMACYLHAADISRVFQFSFLLGYSICGQAYEQFLSVLLEHTLLLPMCKDLLCHG